MAIWTRHKGGGDIADADRAVGDRRPRRPVRRSRRTGGDGHHRDATTHAKVARNRADKVVIGFTLSGELDALAADLAGFERTGDDRADLVAARQLDARAVHLGNQALTQQRENGVRAVTGVAGRSYLGHGSASPRTTDGTVVPVRLPRGWRAPRRYRIRADGTGAAWWPRRRWDVGVEWRRGTLRIGAPIRYRFVAEGTGGSEGGAERRRMGEARWRSGRDARPARTPVRARPSSS